MHFAAYVFNGQMGLVRSGIGKDTVEAKGIYREMKDEKVV